MVVFGLGPLGCIPSLTKDILNDGHCAEDVNYFATLYNDQLSEMLPDLEFSLPGSTFILGRVFGLANDAIMNPTAYGNESSISILA